MLLSNVPVQVLDELHVHVVEITAKTSKNGWILSDRLYASVALARRIFKSSEEVGSRGILEEICN